MLTGFICFETPHTVQFWCSCAILHPPLNLIYRVNGLRGVIRQSGWLHCTIIFDHEWVCRKLGNGRWAPKRGLCLWVPLRLPHSRQQLTHRGLVVTKAHPQFWTNQLITWGHKNGVVCIHRLSFVFGKYRCVPNCVLLVPSKCVHAERYGKVAKTVPKNTQNGLEIGLGMKNT